MLSDGVASLALGLFIIVSTAGCGSHNPAATSATHRWARLLTVTNEDRGRGVQDRLFGHRFGRLRIVWWTSESAIDGGYLVASFNLVEPAVTQTSDMTPGRILGLTFLAIAYNGGPQRTTVMAEDDNRPPVLEHLTPPPHGTWTSGWELPAGEYRFQVGGEGVAWTFTVYEWR